MLKKLTIKQNLIVTTLPYIFVHFNLPPQQVFWYLYFKILFGEQYFVLVI